LQNNDIEELIEKYALSYYLLKGKLHVRCPVCCSGRRSLQVSRETGSYSCSLCSAAGTWFELKRRFAEELKGSRKSLTETSKSSFEGVAEKQTGSFGISAPELKHLVESLLRNSEVVEWFHRRSITEQVLVKNSVGLATPSSPMYQRWKSLFDTKFAGIPNGGSFLVFPQFTHRDSLQASAFHVSPFNKGVDISQMYSNAAGVGALFGLSSLVNSDGTSVVLTDTPLDALVVQEHLGLPAVSRPSSGKVYKLPVKSLPLLEEVEKIWLWMNDDVNGFEASKSFSRKLGLERCAIVNTRGRDSDGPSSAFDALQTHGPGGLERILGKAIPHHHEALATFGDIRTAIQREFVNKDQVRGVAATGFKGLNAILKGHRKGELTILTGPTGIGKTTILSQLSLDYCKSGVITLWGSFEITNTRLAKKMVSFALLIRLFLFVMRVPHSDLSVCRTELRGRPYKFRLLGRQV
jgi:twinkle protein